MDTIKSVYAHVRWMIRRDMPEVMEIEGYDSCPWSEDDVLGFLRGRNCIGMVAEWKEQVIGFMVYELHKSRLHVVKLSVHPDWRRKSVGMQLMERLKVKLSKCRRCKITADIRESNLPGHLFLKSQGFSAVRVDRSAFEDTGEDAYRFVYYLGEHGE